MRASSIGSPVVVSISHYWVIQWKRHERGAPCPYSFKENWGMKRAGDVLTGDETCRGCTHWG